MTPAEEHHAWALLGLSPAELLAVARTPYPNLEAARGALRAFQDKAKRAYKQTVVALHPDHGGDPREFDLVTQLHEALDKLQVVLPVPPPPPIVITWSGTSATMSWGGTTTTGTTGAW